jgi:hypothetical protein
MDGDMFSSLICLGSLLLPVLVGLRLPEWEEPTPARVEKIIEFPDGTRARVYDPADLARAAREARDYYA